MNTFTSLCSVGFLARFSYALARNPVLPLFALYLGAGPEAIGLAVGISTVTGIFFNGGMHFTQVHTISSVIKDSEERFFLP